MSKLFFGKVLPPNTSLIGSCWLIDHLDLKIPIRKWNCVSHKRLSFQKEYKGDWQVFDQTLTPTPNIEGHLEFFLKHEYIDLLVLKNILQKWNQKEIENYIETNKNGKFQRIIWYYYETFLNLKLETQDSEVKKYENLLDTKTYYTNPNPLKSKRHKINDNLLGTFKFSPIIKKTKELENFINMGLDDKAKKVIGKTGKAILRRAASFLLLSDSKASFEIEGERPPKDRLEKWGKIIAQAGKNKLSIQEIERLHGELIFNSKMLKIGLRNEGVFLGERDRDNLPIPEFIGAKPEDLQSLMQDWAELDEKLSRMDINPILHAAIIAFSFVYIHPLEDGNGRIHRYLIHHILGQQEFYPQGIIFPISNVILDKIDEYRDILVSHSSPIMDCIFWEPTEKFNVKVLNETQDFYRYFDCTKASEFLFQCALRTIESDLPEEIHYLHKYDQVFDRAKNHLEISDSNLQLLINFILNNKGTLSENKKKKFFLELAPKDQKIIESIVQEVFEL